MKLEEHTEKMKTTLDYADTSLTELRQECEKVGTTIGAYGSASFSNPKFMYDDSVKNAIVGYSQQLCNTSERLYKSLTEINSAISSIVEEDFSSQIEAGKRQLEQIGDFAHALTRLGENVETEVETIIAQLCGCIDTGTLSKYGKNSRVEDVKKRRGDGGVIEKWYSMLTTEQKRYVDNLSKLEEIGCSEEKILTLKAIAIVLLAEGKDIEFVVGMLGNSMQEGGEVGLFEKHHNTYYFDKVDLLQKQGINYCEDYSNKNIQDVGIKNYRKLFDECKYTNDENYKFGLGCIQWTDQWRSENLLECYEEVCGNNNYPTFEQCCIAEALAMSNELNGIAVPPDWAGYGNVYSKKYEVSKTRNSLADTMMAAEKISVFYIGQDSDEQIAARKEYAKEIYELIMY